MKPGRKRKFLGFFRLLLDYVERFGILRGVRLCLRLNRPTSLFRNKPSTIAVESPEWSLPMYVRSEGSDSSVFHQVFVRRSYLLDSAPHNDWLCRRFRELQQTDGRAAILDIGANIGLSARWFALQFPGAEIYAIEPDPNNFELLRKNVAGFSDIVPIQGAIWSQRTELQVLNEQRDGWAVQVKEIVECDGPGRRQVARGFSVGDLLDQYLIKNIFIAKIDVEGAESVIFSSDSEWLDRTSIVIIELHDFLSPHQHVSLPFFQAISRRCFDFVVSGENLVFLLEPSA